MAPPNVLVNKMYWLDGYTYPLGVRVIGTTADADPVFVTDTGTFRSEERGP